MSIWIIRGLQGLSQVQLSALCGIPQTTISSIENGRVDLGIERAKVLGALSTATLLYLFPGMADHPPPNNSFKPNPLRGTA
jgi:transcriptional regulator with XRE-family HTH domain